MRAGKINVMGVILIVGLVLGLVYLHTFGPYYWDAVSMGEVVKNTAMSCQDRDEKAGKVRLTQELETHEIPTYVEESDCSIHRSGEECTVSCAWTVAVSWPLIGVQRELSFEKSATRGPHSFKR